MNLLTNEEQKLKRNILDSEQLYEMKVLDSFKSLLGKFKKEKSEDSTDAPVSKKQKIKKVFWVTGSFVVAITSGVFVYSMFSKTPPTVSSEEHDELLVDHRGDHSRDLASHKEQHPTLMGRFANAFLSIQSKVNMMQTALEENRKLQIENMNLRRWAEGMRYECTAQTSESETHRLGTRLNHETGMRIGRAIASIPYTAPGHLLPEQLQTLAVSYFKASEFEKSAVIFSFLTGMDENDDFKTTKEFVMTAVSWYRLDNFKIADYYLEQALKTETTKENLKYKAHARLWKALVMEKLDDHEQSQFWLRELIDYHPRSVESSWVNSFASGKRSPASHSESKKEEHSKDAHPSEEKKIVTEERHMEPDSHHSHQEKMNTHSSHEVKESSNSHHGEGHESAHH